MLRFVVLYTAMGLCANAAMAADLSALRSGEMRKLVVFETPLPIPSDVPFLDETGAERRLAEFHGKAVLLNFWATWCAPCRNEMPQLDALQGRLGGAKFQVLTLATGRNPQAKITRFFAEAGVQNLPRFQDEPQAIARAMGVVGLPVSVLINARGHEVARLIGEADWDSPDAHRLIEALIAQE